MAQYPTHAFTGWLRRAALFVVPVGAVSYLPALHVVRAPNPLAVPGWAMAAAPLVCVPAWGVAALAWRAGVHHYEGTGS